MFCDYVKDEISDYMSTIKDERISNIVKYSIEGGKCIRSYITKNVMMTLGGISDWRPIVSAEIIHAASLILDDLPCMDNDRERRGRPSTFVEFGEGPSILVSIMMATNTMSLLVECLESFKEQGKITKEEQIDLSTQITNSWNNTVKDLTMGQMLDLKNNIKDSTEVDSLDNIISLKTASLFSFSFVVGGIFSCVPVNVQNLHEMGIHLGTMFQIMDDFGDVDQDEHDKNYVLINGVEIALFKYNEAKSNLITLLEANSLYTNEMIRVITTIDDKLLTYQKNT